MNLEPLLSRRVTPRLRPHGAAILAVGLWLAVHGSAAAAAEEPPTLEVSGACDTLNVSGTGFEPNAIVHVILREATSHQGAEIPGGEVRVGDSGAFAVSVPRGWGPGCTDGASYVLVALGHEFGKPTDEVLAETGPYQPALPPGAAGNGGSNAGDDGYAVWLAAAALLLLLAFGRSATRRS